VNSEQRRGGSRFGTTQWSVVVAAGHGGATAARDALASLCTRYWYPLYAFARRRGATEHEAQDLVQGFFAIVLEKDAIAAADRDRGRFRSFLVAAFANYTAKEREKRGAQKRGGDQAVLSLNMSKGEEWYALEPADELTPERVFDRRWALTVLDRALTDLRDEFEALGKSPLFTGLLPYVAGGSPLPSYRETGEQLGMSEGAVKVAVHRIRRRYRRILHATVADTVSDQSQVDDELQHLVDSL
jgi:RNA polymerase sigma-70 factor (ECF subfamily)